MLWINLTVLPVQYNTIPWAKLFGSPKGDQVTTFIRSSNSDAGSLLGMVPPLSPS